MKHSKLIELIKKTRSADLRVRVQANADASYWIKPSKSQLLIEIHLSVDSLTEEDIDRIDYNVSVIPNGFDGRPDLVVIG